MEGTADRAADAARARRDHRGRVRAGRGGRVSGSPRHQSAERGNGAAVRGRAGRGRRRHRGLHRLRGPMIRELDELASRRVVLFGGKGGVGKTTISAAAALHYAKTRAVILFTTDPASNLSDLLSNPATQQLSNLRLESLDADKLYAKFLGTHLESFLEIGDRGTYLDREELRRLFELSLPGVDELMAWMHIGELIEENPETLIVVDTAPTGHTLRMLSSSDHFRQLALALDAMQEKHRAMVRQFTRRDVRDAIDAFIDDFDDRAKKRRALQIGRAHV